ncbi:MAG: VCBS repeat-containing protein [Acidobacteria bacterium]|nr:VCBS repeat-containing protein [Acidobacteriota bacterium]
MKWCWAVVLLLPRPPGIPVSRHDIDLGPSETAALADINGDGRVDIVSGENWFEAPVWRRHAFRELNYVAAADLIDDFSDLALDINGDGHIDIVSALGNERVMAWFENPGVKGSPWQKHVFEDGGYGIEFAFLVDLDNDGRSREVLPMLGWRPKVPVAWYEVSKGGMKRHTVAKKTHDHGIGCGDVNGDGRNDILTPRGWYEAPADPRAGEWKWHPEFDLGSTGFLHVVDIDADGRNDILYSKAHDYGIFWLEQGGSGQWTRRLIDDTWAGAHATTLVDLNGDGRKDLLTGKRYLPHNGKDPGEREPLGIYWYEYRKAADGKSIEWIRHIVEYSTRAGGGMQIPVADLDGDGDLDFVVAGKTGLFLFENKTRRFGAK